MPERISIDDWDAVRDELRRFGEVGDVTTGEDRIRLDFGSARLELSKDGRVAAGMPLHDFEREREGEELGREGDVELVVDHDAGALTVDAADVTYTFRRPGRP